MTQSSSPASAEKYPTVGPKGDSHSHSTTSASAPSHSHAGAPHLSSKKTYVPPAEAVEPPAKSSGNALTEDSFEIPAAIANNPMTKFFADMWNATSGKIRLDLRRPVIPYWKEGSNLLRMSQPASRDPYNRAPRNNQFNASQESVGPIYPGLRVAVNEIEPAGAAAGSSSARGGASSTMPSDFRRALQGARVKVSRHVLLGKCGDGPNWGILETKRHPPLDLGIGLSFELDRGMLLPVARARFGDHISLHAFPEPTLRVEGRWRVVKTGLHLSARYTLPLSNYEKFWEPPSRLFIRLDQAIGQGVQVNAFGADVDAVLFESKSKETSLRVAGSVAFPRQIPLEEGEPALRIDLRRLGVRTTW